jgi:hypothetical protein
MAYREKTEAETLAMLIRWFRDWDEATASHRLRAARDRDYYDGLQWTAKDIRTLEDQQRPVITRNRIGPKVNYVLGTEASARVDPVAYPRTRFHDEDAEVVTDALRYLDDKNEFEELCSDVAEELFVDGWGGSIVGVEPEVDGRGVLTGYDLTEVQVPSDQLWWDPHAKRWDFRDALYTGIHQWWDYDLACVDPRYADAEHALGGAVNADLITEQGTLIQDKPTRWFDSSRQRLLVVECYYKAFDPENERVEWFGAHLTGLGFLIKPFRCPLVDERGRTWNPMSLVSAYVRKQENERYGLVRNFISPQDELNHRSSKALHLINVRQTAGEDSAVVDVDEMKDELAKPDGHVRLQEGALELRRWMVLPTGDMAQGNVDLMREAASEINQQGPHMSLMESSAENKMSGRAILARQEMGSMELKPVFDHMRRWKKTSYRRRWWLMKQYCTYEMWLRLRDDTKGYKFVALNRRTTKGERLQELVGREVELEDAVLHCFGPLDGPRLLQQAQGQVQQFLQQRAGQQQQAAGFARQNGQPPPQAPPPTPAQLAQAAAQLIAQDPAARGEFVANDVAQLDADIVINTTTQSALVEHEQFETLSAFLEKHPVMQQKPKLLELLVRAGNFRDKKEIIAALNQGPTPEEAQRQQQVQALQLALQQATVGKTQAEGQLAGARARTEALEAQLAPQRAQLELATAQGTAAKTQADAELSRSRAASLAAAAAAAPGAAGVVWARAAAEARREVAEAVHLEAQARLLLAQAATEQAEAARGGLQSAADVLLSKAEAVRALASARLSTAQADLTDAKRQVVPHEAHLKIAQTAKTVAEAAAPTKQGPEGAP